mgnify:CR=1 FL=1
MLSCAQCNRSLPDGAAFCPYCGIHLEPLYPYQSLWPKHWGWRLVVIVSCLLLSPLAGIVTALFRAGRGARVKGWLGALLLLLCVLWFAGGVAALAASLAYRAGEEKGYSAGRSEGYSQGYSAGRSEGYSQGYSAGRSEGMSQGYLAGYGAGRAATGRQGPRYTADQAKALAQSYAESNLWWRGPAGASSVRCDKAEYVAANEQWLVTCYYYSGSNTVGTRVYRVSDLGGYVLSY